MTATPSESLSPWGMPPVPAIEVQPLQDRKIDAEIAIPGSKSYTNRALILAAAAVGETVLHNPLFSDDSYWCAETLALLGCDVQALPDAQKIIIRSNVLTDSGDKKLFIGSAGTTARFLPGVLAARGTGFITLHASAQLSGRPLQELVTALRTLGAEIETPDNGAAFPMRIKGGSLKGGDVAISGQKSSQFISGLLIAAPLAETPVTIRITDTLVNPDYVRITLHLMQDFGVTVDVNDAFDTFTVQPQAYVPRDIALEADASTATYFFALAAGSGGRIRVNNLDSHTLQPDIAFVRHLENMGCSVTRENGAITLCGPARLSGGMVMDFNANPDSTPTLAAISPFADDSVEVRGVEHSRHHECDRLSVLAQTLEAAGVPVTEFRDGLKISPARPAHVTVDPHDDHRMAMAFAVMGALGAGARIKDPSCVSKTCPHFFDLIATLGVKSTLAG